MSWHLAHMSPVLNSDRRLIVLKSPIVLNTIPNEMFLQLHLISYMPQCTIVILLLIMSFVFDYLISHSTLLQGPSLNLQVSVTWGLFLVLNFSIRWAKYIPVLFIFCTGLTYDQSYRANCQNHSMKFIFDSNLSGITATSIACTTTRSTGVPHQTNKAVRKATGTKHTSRGL